RQVFTVLDQRFDWSAVRSETQSMGLFGDRRLLEIRLGSQRPDRDGSATLCQILENPPDDILLLLVCTALDRRRDIGSKWVTAIEQCGAVVNITPVDATRLPRWIEQRAQSRGLQMDREAVALLSELSEGNLLACAQEIDKLALLFPDTRIGAAQVEQSAGDCSRYTVFDLTDAIARSPARAIKILDGLRAEGTDEIRILWALTREARIFEAFASGHGSSQRLPQHKAREAEQHALRLGLPAIGAALALAARV